LNQVIHEQPPSPRKQQSAIPRDLETITLKCLEKDPDKRYESCASLGEDLQAWLDHKPIKARPTTWMGRSWRWCKRKPGVAAMSAGMLLVLLVATVMSTVLAVAATREAWEADLQRGIAESKVIEAGLAQVNADEERKKAEAQRQEADEQRTLATKETSRALKSEAAAKALALRVQESEQLVIKQSYSADMLVAQRSWDAGNIGLLRDLLEKHYNSNDLRAYEWKYWNRLGHSELMTMEGHARDVISVRFSADGEKVVSGSSDNRIRIWSARNGETLVKIPHGPRLDPITGLPLSGGITAVCFSPDGKHIAASSQDKTVTIWDATTGVKTLTINAHTQLVACVEFSPDGAWLASGGYDNIVKIWNAKTGNLKLQLKNQPNNIECLAFSPDGRRIANGCNDLTINIFDTKTGEKLHTLPGHGGDINSVDFSPDGIHVASASNDDICIVWNTQTGAIVHKLVGHGGDVLEVRYNGDGTLICSSGSDKTLRIWDAPTGREILVLKGHAGHVRSVDFSPDGHTIVSGSNDNSLKIWSANQTQMARQLRPGRRSGIVRSLSFSPDGRFLVTGHGDKKLRVWNTRTGVALRTIANVGTVMKTVFGNDGRSFVTVNEQDSRLRIWNLRTLNSPTLLAGHKSQVCGVNVNSAGDRLVSVSAGRASSDEFQLPELIESEMPSGKLVRTVLFGHDVIGKPICCVAFDPDGTAFVTSEEDGIVRVWNTKSGELQDTLPTHGANVLSMAYSPDGRRIVSGDAYGTIKVWHMEEQWKAISLVGHAHEVKSVVFTPDGKRVVSGSLDGTIKLWDPLSGQELLSLDTRGHVTANKENTGDKVGLYDVCVSLDGSRIAGADKNSLVTIWDARAEETRYQLGLAYTAAGLAFTKEGKIDDAIKAFEVALDSFSTVVDKEDELIDPKNFFFGVHVNWAIALRNREEFQESISHLQIAIAGFDRILVDGPIGEWDYTAERTRAFKRNAHDVLAHNYAALERYEEAALEWDTAYKLVPSDYTLFKQTRSLLMAHDFKRAFAIMEEMLKDEDLSGVSYYNGACLSAIAASVINDDKEIEAEERMEMINSYSTKAVQLLGKAKEEGLFSKVVKRQQLNRDKDLDSLRERDDFKQFVKQLEASATGPDEKHIKFAVSQIAKYDKNKNGILDGDEIAIGAQNSSIIKASVDSNGDGEITPTELATALSKK
ncbi:MAG: hypothetical protein HOB73_10960, partial [Planctomycetaceae bacterium]|nr:hypothetical protein [Planctomycetaceae bacterium]